MQEKNRDISILKQRISQFLDFKGETKQSFYQKTGISNGVLSQNNGMSEENILRFLNSYTEINAEWFFSGIGEMERSQEEKYTVKTYKLKTDDNRVAESVPVYNITAVAGVVAIFKDLHKQEPMDYLKIPNLPHCDGAIYVTGDSMYPLLKSGDIIAYKELRDIQNLFWGEMYLLSIVLDGDSIITVKYVQKGEKEGFIRLVSQNSHHQDKEIPQDAVKFAALVKASIRINSMG